MPISIARSAVAAAIVSLTFAGAAAAAPQYKLVLLDGTLAVDDVADKGWSVGRALTGTSDLRCQRRVCAPLPTLPNDQGLTDTKAYAVNNLGQVAGQSAAGDGTVRHAMLFNGTQAIDLGVLDSDGGDGCTLNSSAAALNDKGQVVGACAAGDGDHHLAFLWQDGVLKILGTLGGFESGASAINRKGHVVGSSERADSFTHAYVYRNGRMHDLGTLKGDLNSVATGINDAGQIVGNSFGAGSHPFIHQDGIKTRLPLLPGAESSAASDINNQGWVVGMAFFSSSPVQGWVYDGKAVYNLNQVLTNFDPRYVVQSALGIADNGQIAVEVIDNQTHRDLGAVLVPAE
jgi:probable HAF family extracellular repeat protein